MANRSLNAEAHACFRCPLTREQLSIRDPSEFRSLLADIEVGRVKSLGGRTVKDGFDQALINSSASVLYPVRRGVPILQCHEGIALAESPANFAPRTMQGQNPRKLLEEIDFWHGIMDNPDYSQSRRYDIMLSRYFGLPSSFFDGKRVLDIGCGPRGSLDCLQGATVRIGLDPLAEGYLQFDRGPTETQHVCAVGENIPLLDHCMDAVISVNSLDHVDDLDPVIAEIDRVLKPGGHFILFTEIHCEPTICEPIAMSWEIAQRFPGYREVYRRETEKDDEIVMYNHADTRDRYGRLFLILQKPVGMI